MHHLGYGLWQKGGCALRNLLIFFCMISDRGWWYFV